MQRTEDRAFPAAEAVERHRHRDGYVHAHHAGLHAMRESARGTAVAGEDRGTVAVFVRVDQIQRGVEIGNPHHAQHRAEDFLAIDPHVRGDVIEQAATEEETVFVTVDLAAAAVDHQRRTFGNACIDIADDFVAMRASDQRAHLWFGTARIDAAGADLQRRDFWRELRDQSIGGGVAHAHRNRDRHAALARGTVACTKQRRHHAVKIGIGQHDHVIFSAAQRLHALAVGAAAGIDIFGDWRGADEADRLHPPFVQQRIHCNLVAMDDVEHAVGQPRLFQQIGHEQRRRRVALGRLEDEGVAAGDGDREHPQRHHRGEIERSDAGDHAQRRVLAPAVDIAADVH